MATTTKIAKVQSAKVEAVKVLEVEPSGVQFSHEGFAWRDVLVRLPKGMLADHLRSPAIWRKVQGSRQTALIKLDHLFVLGFDESWAVRAIVTHASSTEAHLAIEKVFTFRAQGSSFYTDGTLEVFWDGGAYGVRRVSDQVRTINEGFTTEGQAIEALRASYPKKVG